jgi:YD repeat-containing protein
MSDRPDTPTGVMSQIPLARFEKDEKEAYAYDYDPDGNWIVRTTASRLSGKTSYKSSDERFVSST